MRRATRKPIPTKPSGAKHEYDLALVLGLTVSGAREP